MKNWIVLLRNKIIRFFYVNLLKPIYFLRDPEDVHDSLTQFGEFLGRHALMRWKTSLWLSYSHPALEQDILGIHFKNPVGLAAGFDKDAVLTDILPPVGFGFEEAGSVTGEPCEGNPRPRLWRLPKSQALVVYYGLKNEGALKIATRLKGKRFSFPLGISIAKTNSAATVETKAGIDDYVKAFKHFVDIGDYFTVNISCPNAFGGEPFTDPMKLEQLLTEIDKIETKKPIFLKLSPDLSEEQLNAILDVCARHRVQGFISSNLTKKRDNKNIVEKDVPAQGGMSGKVVVDLSNAQIRYIYKKTGGKYIIIGCGGIFSAEDAYAKIKAGASLLQLITGMIFEGPQLVGEINRGLVGLLKKDGYRTLMEARGTE